MPVDYEHNWNRHIDLSTIERRLNEVYSKRLARCLKYME